jgi:predicted dehydrogenase
MKPTAIGIIGCGNISDIYFKNITQIFNKYLKIISCSDLQQERSQQKAETYGCKAVKTEELLADPSIDIILNLTTPPEHTNINLKALEAGKHVYLEKPLAVSLTDGEKSILYAKEKNLFIGCAPDTFLGAGGQLCRKIIDDGIIGTPVAAYAFMNCHGHESWHPDPEFYYKAGGGPMLDMGPYYLTALVNLLGPAKTVCGFSIKGQNERLITSEKKRGNTITVEVPTHITGNILFENDTVATTVMSFDVWSSQTPFIEIHGTKASLMVPNPNTFGGPVKIKKQGDESWQEIPLYTHPYHENSRGIGLADMVLAIQNNIEPRVSGNLAYHVLEVMLSTIQAGTDHTYINIKSRTDRPQPLSLSLTKGELQ